MLGDMMQSIVNIGLIQMSCGANIEENYEKAVKYIKDAAKQEAKIICTQELFKSRYFCQTTDFNLFNLAEKLDENNSTIKELTKLAKNLKVVIIASLFEKQMPGLYYNTTVVIDADEGYLGKYRKMHIPEDPRYYEKYYFTPGDLGFKVFKTKYADIGVLICWDQWFPEAARLTALKGAEIIFYPTAIGYVPGEEGVGIETHDAWQVVQRGHAVANSCYVATVNRVCFEENPECKGGLFFWGQSFVSDPMGKVLKKAAGDREEILICPVDLSNIDQTRNFLGHFFRDRRVDSFEGLLTRYLGPE